MPDLGGRTLIGHDVKPLIEWWLARGAAPPVVEDTAVAAYLLNPARTNYRLEEVAAELLGEGPGLAPPGSRARSVWELWAMAPRALEEVGLRALYEDVEQPLVAVLAAMERHGIRVDPARLGGVLARARAGASSAPRARSTRSRARSSTSARPSSSPPVLFEKLKLPPVKKTKTGYSTDADVLEQLALGHELPAKIIEHRTLAKLKSTYADALPDAHQPAHRAHPHVVQPAGGGDGAACRRASRTYRTSPSAPSSGGASAPPSSRSRAGRFLAADYSQIELRILAHVSGEESLVEAFRRGEDIHRRTAAEVFGVDLAAVTPEQRDVAKTTNFSVIYGVTAFGLSRGLAITPKQAQAYLDQFFARHPKVKAYLERTVAEGRERGYVSDAPRAAPLPARAHERQPEPPRLRRAHGDQRADPGHRRRPDQDRHGADGARARGARPPEPDAAPGPRRAALRGAPGGARPRSRRWPSR